MSIASKLFLYIVLGSYPKNGESTGKSGGNEMEAAMSVSSLRNLEVHPLLGNCRTAPAFRSRLRACHKTLNPKFAHDSQGI